MLNGFSSGMGTNPELVRKIADFILSNIFSFGSFFLLVLTVYAVAAYKIAIKAGKNGYEALIPFYNLYLFCDIVYGEGWKFIFFFIPGICSLFLRVFYARLAQSFGGDVLIMIIAFLFWPIVIPYIGFSDAVYQGHVKSFV